MNNRVFKRKTTPIKFRQNNDVEMSEHYKRTRRPTDQKQNKNLSNFKFEITRVNNKKNKILL